MQISELTPERLRALAQTRPERGLVLSLYLNLDPRELSAPEARHTEIRSLISEAERQVAEGALERDEEVGAREDIERVRRFLDEELDADGAHGLAVFASAPAGLWETVKLARPVSSRVLVDIRPLIEPLVEIADATRWAVLLVNRAGLRILRGSRDVLAEVAHGDDDAHGQAEGSQARSESAVEHEVDAHLRAAAERLAREHRRRPVDALLVGGPEEILGGLEAALPPDLRACLAGRVVVDVEHASPDDVLAAAGEAFTAHERAHEDEALDRLGAGIGAGGRGVGGWADVLGALNEKRVEIFLLAGGGGGITGVVCPHCGWLGIDVDACPNDGTGLGRHDDIAEPAIEAALTQDAEVLHLHHHDDALAPYAGVGGVLRF